MLEMKMDASFEEDLEKNLKEKKKEFEELQKETQHVVQNCFRPEVIEFVKDVNVKLAGWKFESPARFQMVVWYSVRAPCCCWLTLAMAR